MKKKNSIYLVGFILVIIGFGYYTWRRYQWNHPPYSPEINSVLFMSGKNRPELEKVLKYYSQNPADSLKLRAAEFLIINMPDKYSKYYDAPWNDVATVYLRWSSSQNRQSLIDTYGLGEPVVREDVKYITGDYLINNIELAFKAWQEQPWGKHIGFDVFCEEILPYRVSTEPLENWREKARASFADLNRSFKEPQTTTIDACSRVNNMLPRFRLDHDFPAMSYSQLMASARNSCTGMAALAVFAMRALGIPVTVDYIPYWTNHDVGHTWNTVSDSAGRHFLFMGAETNPGRPLRSQWSQKSKVYRHTFARQPHLSAAKTDIPPSLRSAYIQDVTVEYGGCADVDVPVRFPSPSGAKYAYLAAMGERSRWNIVGWGNVESERLKFSSVGTSALYVPFYYSGESSIPAGDLFMLYADSSIRFFAPDTSQRQMLSLTEIAPNARKWADRMASGVFEGANREDFSDARTLHVIREMPVEHFNTVKVKNTAGFRYFRYISPKGSGEINCNVSEIQLYGADGKRLAGTPIGTPGVWPTNPTMTFDKAFDNDVLTFFDADSNDSWTGLDLGSPQSIAEIRYLPRTDGLDIYEGHVYELFYWDKSWQSLGKTKVVDYPLQYEVPANALFYLENVTIHKNEIKVFVTKEGKASWEL
ncbi:MAG: discoidin domain-containing protein [Prevotellaceae bacterium]|jgi:hypothetical protein|nr:discoidin domain-containing protein [Prevotellaceae bacterium]